MERSDAPCPIISSPDQLRQYVLDLLDGESEAVAPDEDLLLLGLDSIRIMNVANLLRRSGVEVQFAELLDRPTLGEWGQMLSTRRNGEAPHAREPVVVDETAPFPLTPVQHAYWIGREDDQVLGGVGCHFYCEIEGVGVDPRRLEARCAPWPGGIRCCGRCSWTTAGPVADRLSLGPDRS